MSTTSPFCAGGDFACPRCALPLPFVQQPTLCGECLSSPPDFSRVLAPWRYEFPLNAIIPRFKYRKQRYFGRALSLVMADYLKEYFFHSPESWPDFLLHVPVDARKFWHRGFDQTHDMAMTLSRQLNIPFRTGVVFKKPNRHAQAELTRDARLRNIQNSFHVKGGVTGARIALVDDVMTTGTTVREIARRLKAAGAADVQVWVLARTPKRG
ncbi:MAG: ComF family protein [Hahellaceae bacterium]|nr:ComF family protein [Hahellaceae bacterium]